MGEVLSTISNPESIQRESQDYVKKESLYRGVMAAVSTSTFALASVATGFCEVAFVTNPSLSDFLGIVGLTAVDMLSGLWAYKEFKSYLKLDSLKHSVEEGTRYVRGGGMSNIYLKKLTNDDGLVKNMKFRTDDRSLAKELGEYRKKDLKSLKVFLLVMGFVGFQMGTQLHLSPKVQEWLMKESSAPTQSVE